MSKKLDIEHINELHNTMAFRKIEEELLLERNVARSKLETQDPTDIIQIAKYQERIRYANYLLRYVDSKHKL